MVAVCDVIYWLLLPWKPIRHHVVSLNWKYKWSLLYVPNFKSIGWIVSKVEGGPIEASTVKLKIDLEFFTIRVVLDNLA